MRAGKLDRRITFQRKTIVQDEYGQEIETWADLKTVWAQQRPVRGDERFAVRQIVGTSVLTFHIRFDPTLDLTIEDRITYDERDWDILDVRELGRGSGLEIDAKARADVP